MPWRNDPESRRASDKTYKDPAYLRNRAIILRDARGHCTQCGRRDRLQVDHITPIALGGTHHLENLQALCERCHDHKTAVQSHAGRQRQSEDPEPKPSALL